MMYIGKAKIDNRGRITIPKSFIEANQIRIDTDVYFLPMATSDNSIKILFETEYTAIKEEDNE